MSALDAVIHAEGRLRIVANLAKLNAGESIAFPVLQDALAMTAGNLSTHLRRLEEAGYVVIEKTHRGRTPVTYLALTVRGRRAFEDYRGELQAMLDGDPGAASPPGARMEA